MRTLLQVLVDATRRLAGVGAVANAAGELDHAARTVADLDVQLRGLRELRPRRAA